MNTLTLSQQPFAAAWRHILLAAVLAAALLGSLFLAQHPAPTHTQPVPANPAPAISSEQAAALAVNRLNATASGYTLHNPRHTATFAPQGLTFAPQVGGLDWRWSLTLAGNAATGAPLAAVEQGAMSPQQADPAIVAYPRGGLTEQYVLHASSIEQQFVIPAPLALDGADLLISGAIESAGTFEQASDGWLWRHGGAVVSLGDVYAFDATGRELPATLEVQADATRLTVNGAALQTAAYPVTIDPEIGTQDFRISDMGPDGDAGYDALNPDVAYNSQDDEYFVVWRGTDNIDSMAVGETEIFSQRIDATEGVTIGADIRLSDMGGLGNTNYSAQNPAVAYSSEENEYLVVWDGDDDVSPLVNQEFEIFGQRVAADGSEVGANDFLVSDMGGYGNGSYAASDPDVVYNSQANEYVVIWYGEDELDASLPNDGLEIFGQRINAANGQEVGPNDFRISNMGPDNTEAFAYEARNAAIAYNSTDNEYLVVWSGDDGVSPLVDGEFEIFGRRVSAEGQQIESTDFRLSDMGTTDGDATYQATRPAVAYNSVNNEYLVVWYGDDDTGLLVENEFEIYGQYVAADGTESGDDFRISNMGPDGNPGFDGLEPDVAYNSVDNEYLVVWWGVVTLNAQGGNETEIFGQRIEASTGNTETIRLSNMGPDGNLSYDATNPAVVFNSAGYAEFLTVWYGDDNTLPLVDGENEIFGQRYHQGDSDLELTKTADQTTLAVGDEVAFTLIVTNTGPLTTPGTIVEDLLPAGLAYVSATGDGTYDSTTGLWDVGPLAVDGEATLELRATVTGANPTNTAQITRARRLDPDSTPRNNIASEDDQASVSLTTLSPPAAVDDQATVAEGGSVSTLVSGETNLLANDSDPEGDALIFSTTPVTVPLHGSLLLSAGGSFSYTHNGSETTSDRFGYEVCDDATPQQCAQATVTISITAVNDAPVAVDDSASTTAPEPVTIPVLANDRDAEGDSLTVTAVLTPTSGTAVISGSTEIVYTPEATASGTDTFTYTVSDGALSDSAAVTVTVAPDITPPALPVIGDGTGAITSTSATPIITGTAEAGVTITLTIDLGGDASVIYTTTADEQGNWSIDLGNDTPSSGTLPADGLEPGTYTIAATATDLAGNESDPAQATLTVQTDTTATSTTLYLPLIAR